MYPDTLQSVKERTWKGNEKDKGGIEGGAGETFSPKPPEDDLIQPLTDAWFEGIFDEIYLERMAMTYPLHDIPSRLRQFKAMVIGSPGDYIYRDNDGIRKAFAYQLRTTKPEKKEKINGTSKVSLEDILKHGHG